MCKSDRVTSLVTLSGEKIYKRSRGCFLLGRRAKSSVALVKPNRQTRFTTLPIKSTLPVVNLICHGIFLLFFKPLDSRANQR